MGEKSRNHKDTVALVREAADPSRFGNLRGGGKVLVVDNHSSLDVTIDSLRDYYGKHYRGDTVFFYTATTIQQAVDVVRSESPSVAVLGQSKVNTSLPGKIMEANGNITIIERPDVLDLALPSEVKFEYDQSLKEYSTMHIGGTAKCVANPVSREGLQAIVRLCSNNGVSYHRRGRGSNTIYGHINGVLINTPDMRKILSVNCKGKTYTDLESAHEAIKGLEKGEDVYVEIEAGAPLPGLSRLAAQYGLSGAEYVIGIPGTIGAALAMNAGVGSTETISPTGAKDIFEVAYSVDPRGKMETLTREKLAAAHRYTTLQDPDKYGNHIVYSVVVRLTKGDLNEVQTRTAEKLRERKLEPKLRDSPHIGSMWRRRGNPDTSGMQWYTDDVAYDSGCAGMSSSNGSVHVPKEKHYVSFFLASAPGWLSFSAPPRPTLYDVVELVKKFYDKVQESKHVKLVLEGRFMGETNKGRSLYGVVEDVLANKCSLADVKDELNI
jgi:UDP-N-acetylmuramate dehydrogenase